MNNNNHHQPPPEQPPPPPQQQPPPPGDIVQVAAAAAPVARARAHRGRTFSTEELVNLFTIMERILPIGPDEWEQVSLEHAQSFAGRDVDSLCRKYHSTH